MSTRSKTARRNKATTVRTASGVVVVGGASDRALPRELVTARMAHRSSGAAGAHADSVVRRSTAAGRTNRVGSRSAARAAAIRDDS